MAKVDRGMAQRYAAKKRRRRSAPVRSEVAAVAEAPTRPLAEAPPQPLEVPAGPDDRDILAAPPPRPQPRRVVLRGGQTQVVVRPAPGRQAGRPFSSYADEYRYVLYDLRRVGLVAGSLLLALILLSFVLR